MSRRLPFALICLLATVASVAADLDPFSTTRYPPRPLDPQRPSATKAHESPAPATPQKPTADTDSLGATYAYDAVGNRIRADYGNGLITEYRYDNRDRLVELRTSRNGALIHHYRYTLDRSGLRLRVDATEHDRTTRVTRYTYDAVKRLTGEIQAVGGTNELVAAYAYDGVGNRTRAVVNGIATDYVYDANDRLVSETTSGGAAAGTTTYAYDANGNRIAKSGPAGTVEYTYDDADRLVESRSAGDLVTYRYGHDRLLLEKTWTPVDAPATTWRYLWDTGRGLPQTVEESSRTAGGDWTLDATYLFGDDLIAQTRNGETRYVLTDGLGDTRALADTGGAVTDTYRYDAWGNVLARTGTTQADHLYRGERFDPNLGFYYLRARYMDPGIGRFTSLDPAEGHNYDPPSLHKYLYTPSDPVNYVDPTGRSYAVAAAFAANLTISAVTVVNTVIMLNDFATGERELSPREIGMAILWAYAGSKTGALFGRLERTLRKAGCLTNSFAADTLVETSDGLRRIDAIRIGDLLLSRNPDSGENEYRPVAAVFVSTKVTAILTIVLEDGTVLEATPEHRVHADGDWQQADGLVYGSSLSTASRDAVRVRSVERHIRHATVFDLSVAGNQNFYVSQARVLVHNISPCEKVAQALAGTIPRSLCENKKCMEFAQAFEKILLTKNVKAKRVCLHSKVGITSTGNNNISVDGNHTAVQVGGLVFDNLYPQGIPIDEWVDVLGVNEIHFGERVMKIWFEEIGSDGCLRPGRNSTR